MRFRRFLAAAVLVVAIDAYASLADEPKPLIPEQFEKLHRMLKPQPGESRWMENGKSLLVRRPGSTPFGFAFELAKGDSPAERIPPGGNPVYVSPRSGYFTDPKQ